MTDSIVYEYIGEGAYRIGLPKRDLYESDMARAEKQGWSRKRIEDELSALYAPVGADEPAESAEEYEDDEPDDWEEIEMDITDEEIDEEEDDGNTVL